MEINNFLIGSFLTLGVFSVLIYITYGISESIKNDIGLEFEEKKENELTQNALVFDQLLILIQGGAILSLGQIYKAAPWPSLVFAISFFSLGIFATLTTYILTLKVLFSSKNKYKDYCYQCVFGSLSRVLIVLSYLCTLLGMIFSLVFLFS